MVKITNNILPRVSGLIRAFLLLENLYISVNLFSELQKQNFLPR